MLAPLSAVAVLVSVATIVATRGAKDRTAPLVAGAVAANVVLSLVAEGVIGDKVGRSVSLTLLDGALFYLLGFIAVCRFDRPVWLYLLTAATGLQTLSHAVYVADIISGYAHAAALNVLFVVQVAALVWGRFSAGEEDLRAPLAEEAAMSQGVA